MQMAQMLPLLANDVSIISEVCKIIRSLAKNSRNRKHLQKVAGDIQAIEKLSDLVVNSKSGSIDELFDVNMTSGDEPLIHYKAILLRTLAALTSDEESCRKKLAENKKFLEELLSIMKSNS